MNTKISFLLVLILLIVLLLFYYIDLESNIIILLAATIIILLHNIISKKEHFSIDERAASLDSKIDQLITIARALRSRTDTDAGQTSNTGNIEGVDFDFSCPFDQTLPDTETLIGQSNERQGIDLRFVSTLDNILPNDLLGSIGSNNAEQNSENNDASTSSSP